VRIKKIFKNIFFVLIAAAIIIGAVFWLVGSLGGPVVYSPIDELGTEGVDRVLIGRVELLGPSIFQQGTHILKNSEGRIISLLEAGSNDIKLDDFLGKEVRVEGKVQKTVEGNGIIMGVEKIERMTGD